MASKTLVLLPPLQVESFAEAEQGTAMKTDSRTRRIAQIGVYGVLLIVLGVTTVSSRLGQRLIGGEFASGGAWGRAESDQPTRRRSLPDFDERDRSSSAGHQLMSPAYLDARESLLRLDAARSQLLDSASSDESQVLETAREEYQAALDGFRNALTRLEAHLEPGMYGGMVHRLMLDRAAQQRRSPHTMLPEWKLTRVQREMTR